MIERALAACRHARDLLEGASAPVNDTEAGQRRFCREQLEGMIAQLTSSKLPERARRLSGMAQMAADQWDPSTELTSAVIAAEREYLRIP
jgi:hypothetical protein